VPDGLATVVVRRAIEETAVRAGSRTYCPGTLRAFCSMTALSHNRVRPLLQAVRDTEEITKGIGDALSAGVTGGNSPLNTNQPRKRKTDRMCTKTYPLLGRSRRKASYLTNRSNCFALVSAWCFATRRSFPITRWTRCRIAMAECPLLRASSGPVAPSSLNLVRRLRSSLVRRPLRWQASRNCCNTISEEWSKGRKIRSAGASGAAARSSLNA
jgi:hypothetical protein